jgi:pimeloyl-ACP methyl ester carboxylesterase
MSMEVVEFPVAEHFGRRGGFGVATESVPGDSGPLYELYFPQELGQMDAPHPIVTWGNGTLASPRHYRGVLHQLASWGLVVVASSSKRTGKGHEMLAGVQHLLAANTEKESAFFGRLNQQRVGALGHSQGAGGTVNVVTHNTDLFAAAVPICLPNRRWVSKGDEYDVGGLACPVLFLGGGRDRIVAGPGTLKGFYDRTQAPAAVASLRGAGHNVIQKTGGGYRATSRPGCAGTSSTTRRLPPRSSGLIPNSFAIRPGWASGSRSEMPARPLR